MRPKAGTQAAAAANHDRPSHYFSLRPFATGKAAPGFSDLMGLHFRQTFGRLPNTVRLLAILKRREYAHSPATGECSQESPISCKAQCHRPLGSRY